MSAAGVGPGAGVGTGAVRALAIAILAGEGQRSAADLHAVAAARVERPAVRERMLVAEV